MGLPRLRIDPALALCVPTPLEATGKMFHDLFFKHPHSVGQTYTQHCMTALGFGATMIVAGAACLVHAFLPRMFERTASNAVAHLYARMTARRRNAPHIEMDYAI